MEHSGTVDYLALYEFDQSKIQRRLAWLNLSAADHVLARRLQRDIIIPNVERLVDQFYSTLSQHEDFNRIVGNQLAHLKVTMTAYMLELGVDFDTPLYFNNRLRLGAIHAQANVPLSLYESAYCLLQLLLLNCISAAVKRDPPVFVELIQFIFKVTTLDMTLAIDAYHRSEVSTLQHQARLDALTGLLNHGEILAVLRDAIDKARARTQPLSAIMADIDFFKGVNDTYGHLAGDEVLVNIANRIRSAIRDFDLAGRYGGEEFLIVLKNTDLQTAGVIAERIRKGIGDSPIHSGHLQLHVTISLGVAALQPEDTLNALIERTDEALYNAKQTGRNRTVIAPMKP
jgi:diguanylate cyclase (GGDEF)-like protein